MIQSDGYALPIQKQFIEILTKCIKTVNSEGFSGFVLNFRDPEYSAETGGYHPVEVAINKHGQILYITDFAYFGLPPMAELCKEIDFDFEQGVFQQNHGIYPIDSGRELFRIWQSNFIFYFNSDVFDVSVNTYV